MQRLVALSLEGQAYGPEIFGGNILANRDRLGTDGTYDDVLDRLGISHLRYPGGSLTEFTFDMGNPDADLVTDAETGRTGPFVPYGQFMEWAEAEGISVTVVLPTRTQLGTETDENGDRHPEIDQETLRGFISDTLDGRYGSPEIRAFEIGNEYWGSGQMSSVEYGRLSSEMALIVKDELDDHPAGADVDVVIQIGQNYGSARLEDVYGPEGDADAQLAALSEDYGIDFDRETFLYGSGDVAWPKVQNVLLLQAFDTPEKIAAVDGVALHIYGRGLDNPNSWDFDYRLVDTFFDPKFGEIERYVTEWNSVSAAFTVPEAERFGLGQAREMLQLTEAMTSNGVDAAHVWAVQQNTATDLSGDEGQAELTVAGEMFRIMAESLPGLAKVDLAGSTGRETELEADGAAFNVFAASDRMVMFIAAGDEGADIDVDASRLFSDPGEISAVILGVEYGDDPLSRRAAPHLETVDPEDVLEDDVISLRLDPNEILRLEFSNPTYDPYFERMLGPRAEEGLDDLIPSVPVPEDEEDQDLGREDLEDVAEDGADVFASLGFLALPLLILMAMAGG